MSRPRPSAVHHTDDGMRRCDGGLAACAERDEREDDEDDAAAHELEMGPGERRFRRLDARRVEDARDGRLELEQPHDEWTGHRHQHTGDRVRSSIADRRFLPTGKALDDDQGGR